MVTYLIRRAPGGCRRLWDYHGLGLLSAAGADDAAVGALMGGARRVSPPLEVIDERRSKRLDFVEPDFEQVIVIQLIYGLPFQNETRVAAAPLPSIVSKGLPTDRLVAHVVVDKYDLHLPLYRQETCIERLGLPLSRSTLMNWCAHAAKAMAPIQKAIGISILEQPVFSLDGTYLPVLEPGLKRCHQGQLWGYRRDPRGRPLAGHASNRQ